jgi:hypothetical protein
MKLHVEQQSHIEIHPTTPKSVEKKIILCVSNDPDERPMASKLSFFFKAYLKKIEQYELKNQKFLNISNYLLANTESKESVELIKPVTITEVKKPVCQGVTALKPVKAQASYLAPTLSSSSKQRYPSTIFKTHDQPKAQTRIMPSLHRTPHI